MLNNINVAVSKPETCPFRKCLVDAEIVSDYQQYCYCENITDKDDYVSVKCKDENIFPISCPLNKANVNVWRDR